MRRKIWGLIIAIHLARSNDSKVRGSKKYGDVLVIIFNFKVFLATRTIECTLQHY